MTTTDQPTTPPPTPRPATDWCPVDGTFLRDPHKLVPCPLGPHTDDELAAAEDDA